MTHNSNSLTHSRSAQQDQEPALESSKASSGEAMPGEATLEAVREAARGGRCVLSLFELAARNHAAALDILKHPLHAQHIMAAAQAVGCQFEPINALRERASRIARIGATYTRTTGDYETTYGASLADPGGYVPLTKRHVAADAGEAAHD